MTKIRIVLIDDHDVVRAGLKLALETEPDMAVVGSARQGKEGIEVVRKVKPDVLLLDVKLDDLEGPEVCQKVRELSPHTTVLMLSGYQRDDLVLRCLKAGAKGYVLKSVAVSELKRMIRVVSQGGAVLDPKVTSSLLSAIAGAGSRKGATPSAAVLSEMDLRIIRHLSEGLTNREIGARVHLSPYTVKDHIEKLCIMLSAKSRTAVVGEAFKRGLL
jgi:DNA-binding NarL/FixJ family response regulator